MNIDSDNLTIRPFTTSDVDDVHEYMSCPDVTYYLPQGVMSKDAVAEFIANNTKVFAICLKGSGKLVGHIEFYPWFGDHTYEIGWALNPSFQRQGIAFEAAARTLKYGFETLGVHRIIATAQPENVASYRLMEKLAMVREGHFRQCIPKGDDIWWDEYFYSMLLSDFRQNQ